MLSEDSNIISLSHFNLFEDPILLQQEVPELKLPHAGAVETVPGMVFTGWGVFTLLYYLFVRVVVYSIGIANLSNTCVQR